MLFDPVEWAYSTTGERPAVVGRKPVGRITIANADAAASPHTDAAIGEAYRAVAEWRRYVPDVDLYLSPCFAIELPAEDTPESEFRLPLSSFLRWVNLFGWAGLAIGNLQLIAPRDETVLAAGLALATT